MSLPRTEFFGTVVRTEQFSYGQGASGTKVFVEVDASYSKQGQHVEQLLTYELAAFGQKASFALSLHPGYQGTFVADVKSREYNGKYYYNFSFVEVMSTGNPMQDPQAPPVQVVQPPAGQIHVSQPVQAQPNPAITQPAQPAQQQPNPYDIDADSVPF